MDDDDFVSSDLLRILAVDMMNWNRDSCTTVYVRLLRSSFGVIPKPCCFLRSMLEGLCNSSCMPLHLLWSLQFFEVYTTEILHSAIANVDEKTIRKRAWIVIKAVSKLELVRSSFYYPKTKF